MFEKFFISRFISNFTIVSANIIRIGSLVREIQNFGKYVGTFDFVLYQFIAKSMTNIKNSSSTKLFYFFTFMWSMSQPQKLQGSQ